MVFRCCLLLHNIVPLLDCFMFKLFIWVCDVVGLYGTRFVLVGVICLICFDCWLTLVCICFRLLCCCMRYLCCLDLAICRRWMLSVLLDLVIALLALLVWSFLNVCLTIVVWFVCLLLHVILLYWCCFGKFTLLI